MSDKKIQVELTEDEAREYVDRTKAHGGPIADVREKIRAALPPEYPEGTVAWVTQEGGQRWIAVRHDGQWRPNPGGPMYHYITDVEKVEPLRVLADDEIAVKHPGSIYLRPAADILERRNFVTTAGWVRSVADALEAEATS